MYEKQITKAKALRDARPDLSLNDVANFIATNYQMYCAVWDALHEG